MVTQRPDRWPLTLSALSLVIAAAVEGGACSSNGATEAGTQSMSASGGNGGEGGSIIIGSGPSSGTDGTVVCAPPCAATEVCSHGTCVPLVLCTNDNECQNDTTCDP